MYQEQVQLSVDFVKIQATGEYHNFRHNITIGRLTCS
jgi:hypothetical protein